jgi:hypothetical protein
MKVSFEKLQTILACLAVLSRATVANLINCTDSNRSFTCWLNLLSIFIPDQSFHKGIFSIHTSDIVCNDFRLLQVESFRYINDNSTLFDTDSIRVTLVDLEAKCNGNYRVGITGGTVSLQVVTRQELYIDDNDFDNNNSTLAFDTLIQPCTIYVPNRLPMIPMTPIPIPFYANTTTCRANFEVPSNGIVFSGSISAHIVELFSHTIGNHVEQFLNFVSCDSIQNSAMHYLNVNLIKFQTWLECFLSNNLLDTNHQGQRQDGIGAHDLLQWIDMPFLQKSIHYASQIINRHLHKGFFLSWLERFNWKLDPSVCLKDCGLFFRGVNGLVRSLLQTSENTPPALNITHYLPNSLRNIEYMMPHLGNVTAHVYNFVCEGLDTIQYFDVGTSESSFIQTFPDGGLFLSPKIIFGWFKCSLDVNLVVVPEPSTFGGRVQDFTLNENFTVAFNASDILVDFVANVAANKESLKNTTVFDVISFNNSFINWDALLSNVNHAEIVDLNVDLIIDNIEIKGLLSEDDLEASLDELLDNAVGILLDKYGLMISDIIKATFRGPIRRSVNKWICSHLLLGDLPKGVFGDSVNGNTKLEDVFHFNESSSVAKFGGWISSTDFLNSLNTYTSCLSSYLKYSQHVSQNTDVSLLSLQRLYFDTLDVNGINLVSEDISHLSWEIVLNEYQNALLRIIGMFDYPSNDFNFNFNVTVQLDSITFSYGSNVLYNTGFFENITLFNIVSDPSFLLYPLSISSGIYGSLYDIKGIDVDIIGSISTLSSIRKIEFSSLNSTSLGFHASSFINAMIDLIQSTADGLIDVYLESNIKTKSNFNPDLEVEQMNWLLPLYTFLGAAFLGVNFYYYVTKGECWNHELIHEGMKSPTTRRTLSRRRSCDSNILFHARTPDSLRIIVPVTVLVAILVFVLSNFQVGATVDIQISKCDGIPVAFLPAVTSFSLGKTVRDMFLANVYVLMSLVLLFSGIWPYVKLLLLLFSFTIPKSRFSVRRRETLLTWLDAMGKYSLVDSFVLVLMLVSFRLKLEFPEIGVIDSYVTPYFGFYLFLIGTIISLVTGNVVTFLHRYSSLRQIPDNQPTRRISTRNHAFQARDFYGYAQAVKLTPFASSIWFCLIISSAILIMLGSTNEFLVFEFQGIVGNIMGKKKTTCFSLISLGTSLTNSVKDHGHFGIRLIQCTYFFFSLLMPLLGLLNMMILTYVPMSLKTLQLAFFTAEICNAWSAAEVFLLSVVVSMLELHQFSKFMVGDKCNFLQHPLAAQLMNDETDCFGVNSSVGKGISYLCTGVLLSCFVNHVGLEISGTVLRERMILEACGRRNETENDDRLELTEEEIEYNIAMHVSVVEKIMKYRYIGRYLVQSQTHRD